MSNIKTGSRMLFTIDYKIIFCYNL